MMNNNSNDRVRFSDKAFVNKSYQNSVLIEGKDVPIIHTWGKDNLSHYPKYRMGIAKIAASVNEKLFGLPNPMKERYIGTETLKVEKYKEVYSPGIGNDAVDKLAKLGYDYRQIARKIGLPVVKEINITHAIKSLTFGRINLMLNEGIDEVWDLITELNAVDYYTNALARTGVGNSSTAAVATQTALIGGSTAFQAMVATYPLSTTAQRVDFKGSYGDGVAEFAWEEFTVDNGATPNANLQRLVTPKGTKSAGETWTAEIQITGS